MLLGSTDSKHGVDDFRKRHLHKDNKLSGLPVGIRFPNLPTCPAYGSDWYWGSCWGCSFWLSAGRLQGQKGQLNIMWKKERCIESACRNDSWGERKLALLIYKSKMWLILAPMCGRRSLIPCSLKLVKVWWELVVGRWDKTNCYWIWNAPFSKLINDWNGLSRDVDSSLLMP